MLLLYSYLLVLPLVPVIDEKQRVQPHCATIKDNTTLQL